MAAVPNRVLTSLRRMAHSVGSRAGRRKPLDLGTPTAHAEIRRLLGPGRGEVDAALAPLHPLLARRCLVLGSAPGSRVPLRSAYDACICINGSPYVAAAHGIEADLLILAGATTARTTQISALSVDKLQGLHANHLLFVRAHDSLRHARRVLREVGFSFDGLSSIDSYQRAAVIADICGEEVGFGSGVDKASNGLFAVLLALRLGAPQVILSGISLHGGHAYAEGTRRGNVRGDERVLAHLADQAGDRVSTCSTELSERFGFAVADTTS